MRITNSILHRTALGGVTRGLSNLEEAGMRQSDFIPRRLFCCLVIILILVLSGCGSRRDPAAGVTIEVLADGGRHLTYAALEGPPLVPDTLAWWDLWSEKAYLFNRIGGVAGWEEGFWLLDSGNYQIVRVDLRGRPLIHAGRQGSGPGEFSFPIGLAASMSIGEIWVADVINNRYSIFDGEGTYLRNLRFSDSSLVASQFAPHPLGGFYYAQRSLRGLGVPVLSHLAWMPAAGGAIDTIATLVGAPDQFIELRSSQGPGTEIAGPPQFDPRLHWATTARGDVVVAGGEEYQFRIIEAGGGVRLRVTAPTPDLRVTAAVKEWFFRENPPTYRIAVAPGTYRSYRPSLEQYPFAERRDAIAGLRVDPVGRICVLANTPDPDQTLVHLYDQGGTFLGTVDGGRLPVAFSAEGMALFRAREPDGADLYWVARLD